MLFESLMKPGAGGVAVALAGIAKDFKAARKVTNVDTGEEKEYPASGNVAFMGGTQYLKLADDQVKLLPALKDGVWIVATGEMRSYKDSSYASNFRILTIDGKGVS